MAKLIVLMGLPGSGKSTYAKDYLEDHPEDSVWCSSDTMRKELYGDENIQGDAQEVFTNLHKRVAEYLKNNFTVIYDATNVNRKSRKSVIKLAKSISNQIDIHGVVVWASLEECLKRDSERARSVGKAVIDKFIRRWESPYYDEGFDSLEIIYNTDESPISYARKLQDNMRISHDNPHHSLGVYEHCEEAERLMAQEPFTNGDMCFIMRYHDCGKPYTKFYKPEDPTHARYYDHHNVGGYLVYGVWIGLEDTCVDHIMLTSWAITNHMEPFFDSKYYRKLPEKLKEKIDLIHKCDINAH